MYTLNNTIFILHYMPVYTIIHGVLIYYVYTNN